MTVEENSYLFWRIILACIIRYLHFSEIVNSGLQFNTHYRDTSYLTVADDLLIASNR